METAGPHKTEAIAISTEDGRRMAGELCPLPIHGEGWGGEESGGQGIWETSTGLRTLSARYRRAIGAAIGRSRLKAGGQAMGSRTRG